MRSRPLPISTGARPGGGVRGGPARSPVARIAVVLIPVAAAVGCGGDGGGGSAVVRRDSAGLEIVRNGRADRKLEWSFTRLFALGGEDEGPESFYEVSAAQVDTDGRGRIYVLDGEGGRVAVFDSAGRPVRTMGRPGGGSGELEQPFHLVVGPADTVYVYDFPKRGFVRWAPDGSALETVAVSLPYFGGGIAATDAPLVLQVGQFDGNRRRILALSATDTVEVAALESPEAREVSFESCPMRFSGLGPVFYPGLTWDAASDRIVVNREADYRLDVYDRGRRIASWRRDVSLREATLQMAIAEIGDAMTVSAGGRTIECDGEEVARKRGYADVLPAVKDLALGPDGIVWVRRGHVRGEDPEIDLLAPDGRYMGTLPPGSPWPVGFVSPRTIVAAERDDLDVERAVVYRIRETP